MTQTEKIDLEKKLEEIVRKLSLIENLLEDDQTNTLHKYYEKSISRMDQPAVTS